MVDQKITQTLEVDASSSGVISVPIEIGEDVRLLGIGYNYISNSTYRLLAGPIAFPTRSDQLGSIANPYMFIDPPIIRSGKDIKMVITNNNAIAKTYEVTFIIEAKRIINIESSGGAIELKPLSEDLYIQLPSYDSAVVPAGGSVDVTETINRALKYFAVDLPEGTTLTVYRDGDVWYVGQDEIGALEFGNCIYFNTIRVVASNSTSVGLRVTARFIFKGD